MIFFQRALLLLVICPLNSAAERVDVGLFSEQNLEGWEQNEFSGLTHYSLKNVGEKIVLSADSTKSASAFYRKIRVDLNKTPLLNWSWSRQTLLNPGDEASKSGDDFVARIYVIKDGGFFFWKTLAINYVWSYQHPRNVVWDNPFAGSKAKMISLQDRNSSGSTWFVEQRNVKQDFESFHGKKIDHIDGVAIMTDSDNSGLNANAYYGDIYFSAN